MNREIINEIKTRMHGFLKKSQMEKLESVLEEILKQQNTAQHGDSKGKKLVELFITAKRIEGCSSRIEEYYLSTLTFFEKNIGCSLLSATTERIREYLVWYQKINNCRNVTLDTIRRILSSFYKWLEEEDYILKSPIKRIHKIKTPKMRKPTFFDEQIEIMRKAAASNSRNIAIIDLLNSSGIRVSELVNLNRTSIDLNSRSCIVFGKGAKQRETYFDVRTKIELEKYLSTRTDDCNALFVNFRKTGKNKSYSRISVNSVEKMIRDIGDMTNIKGAHPHRFRRTMATKVISKGMPIEQVQLLLGHAKINTTLLYANVKQENVKYSYERIVC